MKFFFPSESTVSQGPRSILPETHWPLAQIAKALTAVGFSSKTTPRGFNVSTATVDVSSRPSVQALVEAATKLGQVSGVIHAAGVSPSQASPETILKVDLYGTALVLEEFGNVIARGGSGVVIASQSGHRLPPLTSEQNAIWRPRLSTIC